MKFPKKQAQRLIPEYLLDYTTKLNESHPDPTESWGGGSGGSDYTAGNGIDITNNVISVDNTIAKKSEIPTNYVTTDTDQAITGTKTFTAPLEVMDGMLSRNTTVNGQGYFIYRDNVESKVILFGLPSSKTGGTEQHPTKYTLATTEDIPSLDGYATQTWVENQGYSKFSGSYNELTDTPDLSIYAQSSNLSTVATTGSYNDLTDKPTLATVATSGSYNDLTDKPTIPDTSNFVTIDTNQTITGFKDFDAGKLRIKRSSPIPMGLTFTPDRFVFNANDGVAYFNLPTSKPKGTSDAPTEYTLATTDDIPGTSNFVTIDNAQTITGAKTFQGGLITKNTTFGMDMNIVPSRFIYTYNNQGTIERTLFDLPTEKVAGTEQEPTTYTIATTDDIPTVNNPTITFTQGGATKGTITLNQSGDQTIEFDAGGGGGSSKLYLHKIEIKKFYLYDKNNSEVGFRFFLYNNITTSSNQPMTLDTYKAYFTSDTLGSDYGFATSGKASIGNNDSSIIAINFNNNFAGIQYFSSSSLSYIEVKFDSVDGFEDTVTEV